MLLCPADVTAGVPGVLTEGASGFNAAVQLSL